MTVETKAYGTIEVADEQRLHFPSGLYGFESYTDFVMLDAEHEPLYWLQSIESVDIAFILINPYILRSDYVLDIPAEDLVELGNPAEKDVLVFSIVTIPVEGDVTANLQGPLVINRKQRIGKQSISLDSRWKTKHSIVAEMSRER
jgi:flagellar assembly factor FliW